MNPPRSRKFTRTRTGCFTCRSRRIKCDEARPMCIRCSKGGRRCSYPGSSIPSKKDKPLAQPVPDITSKALEGGVCSGVERDHQLSPTKPSTSAFFTLGTIRATALRGLGIPIKFETSMSIPRPPYVNAEAKVQSFLDFHQAFIIHSHYFWYDDYSNFCKKGLLELAEESVPLQFAIAAYSALLFSVYDNRHAKELAFLYYSQALYCVQNLIHCLPEAHRYTILATILQLASFERFVGDSAKCFRHLHGAAMLLQIVSSPSQQCSTTKGRCLLEWYWNLEDHCCLLLCRNPVLPIRWRSDSLLIRRKLAIAEYPQLSPDARLPRVLDDLWQETWGVVPHLTEALTTVRQLKKLRGSELAGAVATVEKELWYTWNTLTGIRECPCSLEFFETVDAHISHTHSHSECCPRPPFPTFLVFRYPPAAILALIIISMRQYIRTHLYIPARQAGAYIDVLEQEFSRVHLDQYAYELCRTFAAIENTYGSNPSVLLPCFYPLVSAGFQCPKDLRPWLWHKLAHFEESCKSYVEPVKKQVAIYWDMPELLSLDFGSLKAEPLANRRKELNADTIDFAADLVVIEDSDEEQNSLLHTFDES